MKKSPLYLLTLMVALLAQSCSPSKNTAQARPVDANKGSLTPARFREILQNKVQTDSLPGVGAVVFTATEIVHLDVAGVRNTETGSRATRSDKFEVEAVTQILTAMIAAKLVEQGKISWSSKAVDILGLRNTLREEYKNITLNDLLINKIALPEFINKKNIEEAVTFRQGSAIENRRAFANHILRSDTVAKNLTTTPYYNNANYAVANAMLEKVSGSTWEDLCNEFINKPLNIEISTIINEKTNTHTRNDANNTWIVEPYQKAATVLMPANGAALSLNDLARVAQEHLKAARDEKTVFGTKKLKFLHPAQVVPVLNYGWAKQVKNKDEVSFYCNTTKGRSATILILYPKRNLGFAITVNAENSADNRTGRAVTALLNELKAEYVID